MRIMPCLPVITLLAASLTVHACPPKEIGALQSSHAVVAGKVLSRKPLKVDSEDWTACEVSVKVADVLEGEVPTNAALSVAIRLWSRDTPPTFDPGESRIIYLRNRECAKAPWWCDKDWTTADGLSGIQPDNEKVRGLLKKALPNHRKWKRFIAEEPNVAKLSPIEKKMHAIVLPNVDFRCAHVFDVVAWLTGERQTLDEVIVISRRGHGKLKPAIKLDDAGETSPLYKKLAETVLPEVDFRQAALKDVAKHLSRATHSMILPEDTTKLEDQLLITFSLRNVSVATLLRILTVTHPVEAVFSGNTVTIKER